MNGMFYLQKKCGGESTSGQILQYAISEHTENGNISTYYIECPSPGSVGLGEGRGRGGFTLTKRKPSYREPQLRTLYLLKFLLTMGLRRRRCLMKISSILRLFTRSGGISHPKLHQWYLEENEIQMLSKVHYIEYIPVYFPRSSRETISAMVICVSWMMAPAPTPWTALERISHIMFWAAPHKALPAKNTTIPKYKSGLRPTKSDNFPHNGAKPSPISVSLML